VVAADTVAPAIAGVAVATVATPVATKNRAPEHPGRNPRPSRQNIRVSNLPRSATTPAVPVSA
jgi:hypothetical protein